MMVQMSNCSRVLDLSGMKIFPTNHEIIVRSFFDKIESGHGGDFIVVYGTYGSGGFSPHDVFKLFTEAVKNGEHFFSFQDDEIKIRLLNKKTIKRKRSRFETIEV